MVELNLTKRQQEIFDYIKRYGAEHGYPPTVRDIGKAIGLTSSSTVHAHLANLEKVGLLRRDPTKPRALEILVDKAKQAVSPSGLPLVGQVAAGEPMLAEENIEEYVAVPRDRGRRRGRVPPPRQGRLDEGRRHPRGRPRGRPPQDTATDGEIVVALVGEEATVKRFFREERPRAPAARERGARADPRPRRRGAGARRGCLQEGVMTHGAAGQPAPAESARERCASGRGPRADAGAAPRRDAGGRAGRTAPRTAPCATAR